MAKIVNTALLESLHSMANFAKRVGARDSAVIFQKLHTRVLDENLTAKQVRDPVHTARGKASFYVPLMISRSSASASKQKQLTAEFFKLRQALDEALFPRQAPRFPQTDMQGLT